VPDRYIHINPTVTAFNRHYNKNNNNNKLYKIKHYNTRRRRRRRRSRRRRRTVINVRSGFGSGGRNARTYLYTSHIIIIRPRHIPTTAAWRCRFKL